jgi:hypothetical protein
MLRHALPNASYVSFDDPDEELAFSSDPQGYMARFPDVTIFDEAQRVPKLLRYLKLAIDEEPGRMGRFVLSGSNQFGLQKGMSESLAGRIGLLSLLPFEREELPNYLRSEQILHGSYPGPAIRRYEGIKEWFASYVGTYLERDVKMLYDIGSLRDFQTLLRLLAARVGQEQNASSLAREIGVSGHTVEKWISVLDASYLSFALKPFHGNIGKRLVKRPKRYFWDTGLVCHLTGIRDHAALEGGLLCGPLFENLVISELAKRREHSGLDWDFYYYRDNGGAEIDLIVEDKAAHLALLLEVKSGSTAKIEWAARLERASRSLLPRYKEEGYSVRLMVVYRGVSKPSWPKPGIDFLNYEDFLRGA